MTNHPNRSKRATFTVTDMHATETGLDRAAATQRIRTWFCPSCGYDWDDPEITDADINAAVDKALAKAGPDLEDQAGWIAAEVSRRVFNAELSDEFVHLHCTAE